MLRIFEMPEYVVNTDGIGVLRILESIRYWACVINKVSTSEYGKLKRHLSQKQPFIQEVQLLLRCITLIIFL